MWEIIKKNRQKSLIVFSIMIIWYIAIYGCIFAFFVYAALYNKHSGECLLPYQVCLICGVIAAFCIFCFQFFSTKNKPYTVGDNDTYRVTKKTNSQLYNIVEEMAIASGLSIIPKIYILDSPILNAYACGINPKNASIVVSKGLMEILNRDELQGVIAHETSHIVNRDTTYLLCCGLLHNISSEVTKTFYDSARRGGRGALMAALIALISLFGQSICFILFMFISRKREYLADACACQYTRYPKGLANALLKINKCTKKQYLDNSEENANYLVRASFIVPLQEDKDSFKSTHPSTKNRIKILLNMTDAGYRAYEREFKKINGKNLIPSNTLKNSKDIKIRSNTAETIATTVAAVCATSTLPENAEQVKIIRNNKTIVNENIQKHREIEDFVRDVSGYTVINCECDTKLKIPPIYKNQIVICPHCNKKHFVHGE